MTIWTLLGYILQAIGNIVKRSDILFLGYYLAGTGKTRSLPEFSHELVIRELFDYGVNCDEYEIHVFENKYIYKTVGKCWVKVENNSFIIKDTYMFYPVCDHANTHFSDCNCSDKVYSGIYERVLQYPQKFTDMLIKYNTRIFDQYKKLSEFVEIHSNIFGIDIRVNDEFWVNKGKKFDVYSEIPVCE